MNNPELTLDLVMDFGPCHDREKVAGWFGDREQATLLDALQHPDVTTEDKVWLLCRALPLSDAFEIVESCVNALLQEYALTRPDEMANVTEWVRNWLNGSDRTWPSVERISLQLGDPNDGARLPAMVQAAAWLIAIRTKKTNYSATSTVWLAARWIEKATPTAVLDRAITVLTGGES